MLRPWGDTSARRGFYDAIAAGAIPVIFEPIGWEPAGLMLGLSVNEVSVLIPITWMMPGRPGALAYLRSLPNSTVQRLHDNVMAVRTRTQYITEPGTPNGDAMDTLLGLMARHFEQLASTGGTRGLLPALEWPGAEN